MASLGDVIAKVVPAVLAHARLPGGDPLLNGHDIGQWVDVKRRCSTWPMRGARFRAEMQRAAAGG